MKKYSLYHQELLNGEYQPKVFAYYFKQWRNYQMPFHSHIDIEIMYVIEGSCLIITDNEELILKKGDYILLDSEVPHRLIVDEGRPCRMLNVEFSFLEKDGYFPSIKQLVFENKILAKFLSLKSPYLVLKDTNEIFYILKNLVFELDKRSQEKTMVQLLLAQLLIQIARMAVAEHDKKIEQNQQNRYVKKVIAYLHENYDCDLKVNDIAKTVNLHPGYLQRIFKSQMNLTLIEYLMTLRMEKAKMLLKDTDIPIIEICNYVGVNSRQYFSLLFKKYTNKTPLEFRKLTERNIVIDRQTRG